MVPNSGGERGWRQGTPVSAYFPAAAIRVLRDDDRETGTTGSEDGEGSAAAVVAEPG
jgi:hypothetical protein